MKKVIFALGILFVFACSKTEVPIPPTVVVQEESIKFTTNLDTGTYNVADTLPLVISVSSKIPTAGIIFSITTTWVDSSKQIFKLDTSISVSSLSLNIPGMKKSGSYNISITVTSKSTAGNTLNKSIGVVNNPLGRFMGYKVDPNAKHLGIDYWKNIPVLSDLISIYFHEILPGRDHIGTGLNTVCGDFNNDGYVDVFAPGNIYGGSVDNGVGFLIWNPITKKFDDKNLFNDKSKMSVIWGTNKVVPVYLNNDDYVDLVIIGFVDEGLKDAVPNPISLAISDGKGGYDLIELTNLIPDNLLRFAKEGGDLGDLNGDNIMDLFIASNSHTYIFWGIPEKPYFTNKNYAHFASDIANFKSDNGFGEVVPEGAEVYGAKISDINNDGLNDIILNSPENGGSTKRIMINQGKGRFNQNGIIKLPLYGVGVIGVGLQDCVVDDLNNDGLKDIIGLINLNGESWNIIAYIQQGDGSYKIDNNIFQFTINNPRLARDWKSKLIYNDFNGDGKKDIAFLDGQAGNIHLNDALNIMIKKRSVFIRTGNQFIEQDFYQFDPYMKSLLVNVK